MQVSMACCITALPVYFSHSVLFMGMQFTFFRVSSSNHQP